jgi:hypothetical protein
MYTHGSKCKNDKIKIIVNNNALLDSPISDSYIIPGYNFFLQRYPKFKLTIK